MKRFGPFCWKVLHHIGKNTSINENTKIKFIKILTQVFPCEQCKIHMWENLYKLNTLDTNQWLYQLHNDVNKLLEKPLMNEIEFKEKYHNIRKIDILVVLKSLLLNISDDIKSLQKINYIFNFFDRYYFKMDDSETEYLGREVLVEKIKILTDIYTKNYYIRTDNKVIKLGKYFKIDKTEKEHDTYFLNIRNLRDNKRFRIKIKTKNIKIIDELDYNLFQIK